MRVAEYVRSPRDERSDTDDGEHEDDGGKSKRPGPVARGVTALLLLGILQTAVALALAVLFALVELEWPTLPGSFDGEIVVNGAILAVGVPAYWIGARADASGTIGSVLQLTLLFAGILFSVQAYESMVYALTGEPKYGLSFLDVPEAPLLLAGIVVVGLGLPFLALTGYHGWRSVRE